MAVRGRHRRIVMGISQALMGLGILFVSVGVGLALVDPGADDTPCNASALRLVVLGSEGHCRSDAAGFMLASVIGVAGGAGMLVGSQKLDPRPVRRPKRRSRPALRPAPRPAASSPLRPLDGVRGHVRAADGELRIEHPYLLAPIRVRLSRVAATAPPADGSGDDALGGPVRRLALPGDGPTNLSIVFDPSLRVGPLTDDARVTLGLADDHERVDVLQLAVTEVGRLVPRLRLLGVRRASTELDVLHDLLGDAPTPVPVAELARRRVQRAVVAVGAALAGLLSVPAALFAGRGPGTAAALELVVVACFVVVGVVARAAWPPVRRTTSAGGAVAQVAVFIALAVAPGAAAGWLTSAGMSWVLAYGATAGVPGGLVAGVGAKLVEQLELEW